MSIARMFFIVLIHHNPLKKNQYNATNPFMIATMFLFVDLNLKLNLRFSLSTVQLSVTKRYDPDFWIRMSLEWNFWFVSILDIGMKFKPFSIWSESHWVLSCEFRSTHSKEPLSDDVRLVSDSKIQTQIHVRFVSIVWPKFVANFEFSPQKRECQCRQSCSNAKPYNGQDGQHEQDGKIFPEPSESETASFTLEELFLNGILSTIVECLEYMENWMCIMNVSFGTYCKSKSPRNDNL